jgi:hypothetical protein
MGSWRREDLESLLRTAQSAGHGGNPAAIDICNYKAALNMGIERLGMHVYWSQYEPGVRYKVLRVINLQQLRAARAVMYCK